MALERYLNKLKDLIDRELDRYLPSEKEGPRTIHKAMRYSVFSGGKRIRPILVIESCRICGGQTKQALPIAVAIELIHTYSLIHDDLPAMDNDDYRRGKPTCHKAFGEANAILAGDALLTLAFNIISKRLDSKTGSRIIKELSEAIGTRGMVGGQAADLEFKDRKKNKETLNYINRLKTSKLFECSARLGAMAAGCTRRETNSMARFGASLGMAFQIMDDMIDCEGYAEIFGMAKAENASEELKGRARNALTIFGKKAARLIDIMDWVLIRGS